MGFDGSMMNGLQGLDSFMSYFGHPNGTWLGLMNGVMFIGGVILAFPAAWLSDTVGRRYTMFVGISLLIAGAAMQAASHNLATFIISRFIVGCGVEFSIIPAPVLITELAYPPHRGKVTGLFQTCFYLGAIASSWITFGTFTLKDSTWSWRIPSLMQAFFPLVQLLGLFFVPESPRWLVSKGKLEQARSFFTKYHAGGDDSHPLVDYEMQLITAHLEAEGEVAGMGWSSLWKTKGDKKRLFIAAFTALIQQWSGNGIITYYLALVLDSVGIKDSFEKTLINGILQIFNFLAAIFGAFCIDKLGRRTLWLTSCICMLASFSVFTALSGVYLEGSNPVSTGRTVVAFIFIYFFFYDIGVTPLSFAYPVEILPFHTRQKGLAITNMFNTFALVFNAFVNPIAIEAIAWKYYLVYVGVLVVITIVVYLFYAETAGRSLEEISEIFDGPIIVASFFQRRDRRESEGGRRFESGEDVDKGTVEYLEKAKK
ncbi:uncharacterized protein N0V89_006466 [Didymosphaeria variabile]|uniref:Major facilitator superfamily (MFS) profile domain-containing protein n=1 Tax=Didymosphaeria variabile TaxID=1932322 RepID=A0A9W8XHN2_9PLEO|nr:uncharacterized protein N0V89_006466 [Didymosphaeria variabile]KAJ4351127.1 hypothetical protein N0V89_006466 [Didymosphaeria variabile]